VTLFRLGVLVAALSLCIGLALSNPTLDEYLAFVENELAKAIERGDGAPLSPERAMVRTIFRSHSHELVASAVRPHTVRRNWGLVSIYDTSVFNSRIVVLGVAGRFIPLQGIDEAIVRLGRLAF
jgi:uncharacterized protein DUF4359